jgi:hypothetical protein
MVSNCSRYPLKPIDPSVDPAYQDGPPPLPHRANHAGEIPVEWPVAVIPQPLRRLHMISIEALEDEIEREAELEERLG